MSKETIDLSKYSRNELEKEYIKLYTRCAKAEAMADRLLENYKLAQDKRFGKSSEKGMSGQITFSDLNLLNDLMTIVSATEGQTTLIPEEESSSSKSISAKSNSKHKDLINLAIKSTIFKLSEDEMICPKCGAPLHFIKDTERIEVVVEQPKVYVQKYITKHYACRNCEKNDEGTFVTAPGAPLELFKNSPASPSAVADCIHKKYVLATPFDRQAKDYEMQGIPITKNNMCHWSIMAANRFFSPIVERMHTILMKEAAIHCDETFTRIINEEKDVKSKLYIWVTTTAEYQKEHPIALYNYQPGRSDADARRVLKDYDGYVMCDGYACYDSVMHKSKATGEAPLK